MEKLHPQVEPPPAGCTCELPVRVRAHVPHSAAVFILSDQPFPPLFISQVLEGGGCLGELDHLPGPGAPREVVFSQGPAGFSCFSSSVTLVLSRSSSSHRSEPPFLPPSDPPPSAAARVRVHARTHARTQARICPAFVCVCVLARATVQNP